jgi:uncharacterized protein with PQ loop repeat
MYTASGLYIVCYLPELYANYKNKNANFYNVPEKLFIFFGTILAFSYALIINNPALILHYGPILILDTTSFVMKIYYAYNNCISNKNTKSNKMELLENDTADIMDENSINEIV